MSVGGGIVLAVAYTASPLGVLFLIAAPLVCVIAGRGLDPSERKVLGAILGAALAARLIVIIGMFVVGIPQLNDLAIGALTGDEAYNLGRSLRQRDILLGFGGTHYDYFVAGDEYGRTSYLALLTQLQLMFGPAPYGLRLLNALLFTTGAAVLFRIVRPAYGAVPAFAGLVVVLFLPSVFHSSISLLKESLYFLAVSTLLASAVSLIRLRNWTVAIALLMGAASLWVLDDLRRGAIVLAGTGIASGVALRLIVGYRWRMTAAAAAVVVALAMVATRPPLTAKVLDGLAGMAKTHSGHVFTVGHAYKLLDPGYYMNPSTPAASTITLSPPQAARFVIRSIGSFIFTPFPWQAASLSELAFLPEHLLWYVMLALLPFGLVAGWRRDALVTAILIGFVLPTCAALAFTNGNVGTLLRLRGLVSPYVAWISVLGLCAIVDELVSGRSGLPLRRRWSPPLEGTTA